jgi:hypothetical protein
MPSTSGSGLSLPIDRTNAFPNNTLQGGDYFCSGPPVNGTSCVQTITFGGSISGGGFTLGYMGYRSVIPVPWSATDATLEANIAAALGAFPPIGNGNVAVVATTGSSGIGAYTITFVNQLSLLTVPPISVGSNLIGTNPTVAIAVTTVGITATCRGCLEGTQIADQLSGNLYINKGTNIAPNWTQITVP